MYVVFQTTTDTQGVDAFLFMHMCSLPGEDAAALDEAQRALHEAVCEIFCDAYENWVKDGDLMGVTLW